MLKYGSMATIFSSIVLGGLPLAALATNGTAQAVTFPLKLQSISALAFGPKNVLFAADWRAGRVDALTLPPAASSAGHSYNMLNFDLILRKALGTDDVKVEAIAQRPGTDQVYVALSVGRHRRPAILMAEPNGRVIPLDLKTVKATSAILKDVPDTKFKFWGKTPLRSFTVTAMRWHDGKLFVAGLTNQTFSSSLRIIGYPFAGTQSISSVAMYHTTHNQIETRAPIREMAFETLNGTDTLVAAFLCSPLVTVPVAALKNGAHVEGKTIAELGYGNYPNGLVAYSMGPAGHQQPYILITNYQRSADLIPAAEIAAADRKPGLSKPVPFGDFAGVKAKPMPYADVIAIDNQNAKYLVALRRNLDNGHLQLVSYNKTFNFRVADFVSEYDFPSYKFTSGFETKDIKPVVTEMDHEEDVTSPGITAKK